MKKITLISLLPIIFLLNVFSEENDFKIAEGLTVYKSLFNQ